MALPEKTTYLLFGVLGANKISKLNYTTTTSLACTAEVQVKALEDVPMHIVSLLSALKKV